MEKDNGIKCGYEIPIKDAGRDVLLEVLSDPSKQGRFNRKNIVDQPAKPTERWGTYSECAATRFTHS